MSTTAASRHVAELEAHLQTRLLNRTTRRVSLTEAAARHAGIVFEPAFIVGPEVRAGRLVPLLQEFAAPPMRFSHAQDWSAA